VQLGQSFEVARPIDAVWRMFGNLRATASCIPGAEITEIEDNRKATGVFRIQLGPIKAAFAGEAEISRDEDIHAGTIVGAGRDGKNATRVKATVVYTLAAVGDAATRVDLVVDYAITGSLAQFSRSGIVKDIAEGITRMFAGNLEAMLAAAALSEATARSELLCQIDVEGDAVPRPVAASQRSRAAQPQSLNVVILIWSMLWDRIAGIFKLRGR
jgi:carbon monoxide dehydrogenase subunit G